MKDPKERREGEESPERRVGMALRDPRESQDSQGRRGSRACQASPECLVDRETKASPGLADPRVQ